MQNRNSSVENWFRGALFPIIVFVAVDLVITLAFFIASVSSVHVGTLRPENTILPKIAELALIGVALGMVAALFSRRIDLNILTLSTVFTVLLDLDHIPSALGISQPIRPAHSLVFLAFTLVALIALFRKRPEVPLIFIAAFLGHLAADTGVFAILAPFSFQYSSLDAFRVPLAVGAVAFALLAGYARKARGAKDERQELTIKV